MARERSLRTGEYDLPADPTLEDLLLQIKRQVLLELRVHVPAQVVAFNPATAEVDVIVGFITITKQVINPSPGGADPNASNGEMPQPPLPLSKIPVRYPSGGAGGRVTFELVPGDTGTLEVHDRSLVQWMLGAGGPVDPVASWAHRLQDSEFVPGMRTTGQRLGPIDPAALVLGHDVAVKLGSEAAALGVARLTDQTAADATMSTWISQVTAFLTAIAPGFNATPPGTPVVSLGAGGVVPPVAPSDFGLISTASTKVTSD